MVLDIGANFGYYPYPLSRAVGRMGRVYAFEPVPFTHRTLQIVSRLLRVRNAEVVGELVRLDDFLPSLPDLSFITIDVEGAELFAFRGAERTIEVHGPTVLCEINPWYLAGFGSNVDELTSFFFSKGYELYRYDDGRLMTVLPSAVIERNYVFVHPSRTERLMSVLNHRGT